MQRKIVTGIVVLVGCFGILAATFLLTGYKATEIPESECKTLEGVVTSIGEGGVKDATFTLAGTPNTFYINRGLENKFLLADLRRALLGKKVTVSYSDHTNFLSGKNPSRHIRKLQVGSHSFYSEF